ncbi:DMT family transporter [Actinomadura viridis]|uniref:Drug/metabolite transporter (DMT)-like permease n=1 Tax=Actinomadura viridis TaxID=58110 RepID=A0A931GPY1_9ACTN|nr:EamA family transporter [Actinomadura viridis]MBG6091116.1 drug/metabolite transporter (DMT)-like permease [Actinomadura viridis]
MGPLLALASAVVYGVADVWGGLLSRRAGFASVALAGQLGGLALTLLAAPFVPAADPAVPDLAWGALSGVGTGLGMVFLYRGLSRGSMSVVVPVSAVNGLALPVLAGVVLLGDRPSPLAWLGVATAVPALWLVSRDRAGGGAGTSAATADALVAGLGIGVQYLALAQAGAEAGIWPVVTGRCAAVLAILPLLRTASRPDAENGRGLPPRLMPSAALTGGLAALALILYLLATRSQLVAVAVVLSSLYPAIPVILGVTLLGERLRRAQAAGLAGVVAAIALLTAG